MSDSIRMVNDSNFDQEVKSVAGTPVFVDFWAPWCGPCRTLSPLVDELADELAGSLKVAKCNVDENQDIAMEYGVMSIPTLVLLKQGVEVKRTIGAMPKARLESEIKPYL